MKKLLLIVFIVLCQACSYSSVDAGEEAVLIYKPYVFGHGGVDSSPVSTGAVWTVWSTSVARYNIKPAKYTEKFIDLTASDNVAIDFNVYVTLKVIERKTPVLHEKSGEQWYINKVQDVLRTIVRNEGRTRSSIELRTLPQIITASQHNIKTALMEHLKLIDLPVRVTKVVIGKVVPPKGVLDEAERTASQKQREKTQLARAGAELLRAKAEKNMALADKAYADQFRMTTAQFLKNKELDIMLKAVESGKSSIIINASDSKPYFKAN